MSMSFRLLLASGFSGASVMIFELSGTRVLAPVFGSSLYTWTNVIAVVLLALTLGYWLGGRLVDRRPEPRILGRILFGAAILGLPSAFFASPLAQWLMPPPQALSVFDATPHVIRGSLAVTLIIFAPPLFLMGMVGPFVTRCLMEEGSDGGRAAGRTLAAGTLGSLVGTILPAHFLIPFLGVRATLLFACALLVVAALICLPRGRARAAAAILFLLVPAAAFASRSLPILGPLDPGSPPWPGPREVEVIAEKESPYQYLRLTRWSSDGQKEMRLSLDDGVLEYHSLKPEGKDRLTGSYYDRFLLLPELLAQDGQAQIAVLGGGAGTMAALMRRHQNDRVQSIINVEIDPDVAALAPRFGWNPQEPDATQVADARVFLAASSRRFDIIILDAYAHQIAIPFHLASVEFFRLAASRLNANGILALNLSVVDVDGALFAAMHKTLAQVFPELAVVTIPGSWNVMLLASKAPISLPGGNSAELRELRSSFRRGFSSLDSAPPAGILLSDDRAPLEILAHTR